ncbi:MAG: hypothetical protein ABL908_23305 [Hyphomicrobium sp.]
MTMGMRCSTNPARHIRERVFGAPTQESFGLMLGYSQAQISRFEDMGRFSARAQERIRRLANDRRIAWDNNLFFEVPREVA